MELLRNLFEGYPNLWGGGVAHSVLILSLVIAFGIILAKIKIAGISLGVTWILFVGIVFGHFNLSLDEHLLHFLKEFGLILFVFNVSTTEPRLIVSQHRHTHIYRYLFRRFFHWIHLLSHCFPNPTSKNSL